MGLASAVGNTPPALVAAVPGPTALSALTTPLASCTNTAALRWGSTTHAAQAEVATSAPVSAALDALHEWSAGTAAPEALLTLMAQGDDEQLKALQQQGDALLADLENALTDLGSDAPRGARRWLRASAYGGIAAAARLQEWLAGRRATDSAAQLADLVQVCSFHLQQHSAAHLRGAWRGVWNQGALGIGAACALYSRNLQNGAAEFLLLFSLSCIHVPLPFPAPSSHRYLRPHQSHTCCCYLIVQ